MHNNIGRKVIDTIGLGSCLALAGCVSYVDAPRGGSYVEPPSAYIETQVAVQPEYVYYPGYEVYYSRNTHRYVYRNGHSWVSRSAPPHISTDVLLRSPSVQLNFHDHPSKHHSTVAQQYPRGWAPVGQTSGHDHGHNGRE